MAPSVPAPTVRVEVGSSRKQPAAERSYELQETPVDALSELPFFPAVAVGFYTFRLVRPIIVQTSYSGGPQEEDTMASLANTFVWMAAVCGILGAITVSTPFRDWLKIQGATPKMTWNLEPTALALLTSAVVLDVFHQIFALASHDYFWSNGIVRVGAKGGDDMGPFFLILLHCAGLLGFLGLFAAYARCFRSSWRKFSKGPPRGYDAGHRPAKEGQIISRMLSFRDWLMSGHADSESDVEEGRKPARKVAPARTFDADAVPTPSRAPSSQHAEAGPRSAGSAGRPPPAPGPTDEGTPHRNSGSSRVEPEPRPSPGTPPRAWFWNNIEWVPVRIMRTMPDGGTYIRLAGGNVVTARQHQLRPRIGDEPPPPLQTSRPSSAGGGRSRPSGNGERRRPSWSPGPSPPDATPAAPKEPAKGGRASRPSSAPPSGRAAASVAPAEQQADGEGALWAASRKERLMKELKALDGKSHAERRFALRQLQRELHPDKQPPELRPHAQPLFMVVQKEWEVGEACAKAASEK